MSDETIAVIAKLVEDKYDSKEARLNEQRAVSSTEIARARWGAEGTDSLCGTEIARARWGAEGTDSLCGMFLR